MSKEGNTLLGFLAGATAGALLGVLFAPDKGEKTRKKIADEAKKSTALLKDEALNLKNEALTTYKNASETLEESVDHLISNFGDKSDDVIEKLEAKLALLKKKSKEIKSKA